MPCTLHDNQIVFIVVQQDVIDRATATLACTDSEARIALRHYRWNLDRLMGALTGLTVLHLHACVHFTLFERNHHATCHRHTVVQHCLHKQCMFAQHIVAPRATCSTCRIAQRAIRKRRSTIASSICIHHD